MDKENLKKITALLVHVAKVDEIYSEKEKNIIRGKLEQVLTNPASFKPEGSRICTLMYYIK